MVSKFTILTNILLASGILAVPSSSSQLHNRLAPLRKNLKSEPISNITTARSASDVVWYSPLWAGAVLSESEGTFTTVTGTFTVPTLTQPATGSGVAAWVGIDGSSCQPASLMTGIAISVGSDGQASYDAFHAWHPDAAIIFTGFIISPGDEIRASVTAYSTTCGQAVIENLTTGNTVSEELTSSHPLCEQDAEWIVEDFSWGGDSLVPFADFGTIEFTSATATDSSGTIYTPGSAAVFEIKQNNTVLTSVVRDEDSVTVNYVQTI